MTSFDKKYYDDIWGEIGGVHRHDYCESLTDRLIKQYGKVRILDCGTGCGHLVKLLGRKAAMLGGLIYQIMHWRILVTKNTLEKVISENLLKLVGNTTPQ